MAKTLPSQSKGHEFHPWSGTKILHAAWSGQNNEQKANKRKEPLKRVK